MNKTTKIIIVFFMLILGAFTIGVFLPFPFSVVAAVIYGALMGMVIINITINYY